MRRAAVGTLASIAFGASCAGASDFNPLGFCVGASVGRSDVSTEIPLFAAIPFDAHATGWKVFVGMRPVALLGAELAYIDFGHPNQFVTPGFEGGLDANVLQRAQALSGLFYLPIPAPFLDVYARAGLARLESSVSGIFTCPLCPTSPTPGPQFSRSDTDFLYGAGLQLKLTALAVRLEYERINDNRGDPNLLSVGMTWTF